MARIPTAAATDPTSVIGTRMASPRNMHTAVAAPTSKTANEGVWLRGMDLADAAPDQPATSDCEQQPAGRNKVAVETLEQREQGRRQNYADDPSCAHRLLKGNCGHELVTRQLAPGSDVRQRRR